MFYRLHCKEAMMYHVSQKPARTNSKNYDSHQHVKVKSGHQENDSLQLSEKFSYKPQSFTDCLMLTVSFVLRKKSWFCWKSKKYCP